MSKRKATDIDEEAVAEAELQAAIEASGEAPADEKLPGLGVGVAPIYFKVESTLVPQYQEGCKKGEKSLLFVYLTIRGLGEVPRIMLAECGASYDHMMITMGESQEKGLEWRKRSPQGLLPMLSGLGIPRHSPISQSSAIIRFLAKRYGFCGRDDAEEAKADVLFETVNDFFSQKAAMLAGEGDASSAKSYISLAKCIERMLGDMPAPSDHAAALNFGQIRLLHGLLQLEVTRPEIVSKLFPALDAFRVAAAGRPRIATYLASPMRMPPTCNEVATSMLAEGGYNYATEPLVRSQLK